MRRAASPRIWCEGGLNFPNSNVPLEARTCISPLSLCGIGNITIPQVVTTWFFIRTLLIIFNTVYHTIMFPYLEPIYPYLRRLDATLSRPPKEESTLCSISNYITYQKATPIFVLRRQPLSFIPVLLTRPWEESKSAFSAFFIRHLMNQKGDACF